MKRFLFSVAVLTLTSTVFAQSPATPAKTVASVAKFDSEIINLGNVRQSTPAKATFTITNIGTDPLIIEQANPTCGCTISDYTKSPIAPGQTGQINATYNAANLGHFEKHLTVKFAGINEIKSIALTGTVLPAADFDKWKQAADSTAAVQAKATADSIAAASKPAKKHKKKG
ncbi:MAG: DUF1573 domain-containing protein [Ferruginibacter sp.]